MCRKGVSEKGYTEVVGLNYLYCPNIYFRYDWLETFSRPVRARITPG